jgi:hypothetical protein
MGMVKVRAQQIDDFKGCRIAKFDHQFTQSRRACHLLFHDQFGALVLDNNVSEFWLLGNQAVDPCCGLKLFTQYLKPRAGASELLVLEFYGTVLAKECMEETWYSFITIVDATTI